MTFSTIQTRIKNIVNITGSGLDNLIKDAIRWALDEISTAWNWPYLIEPHKFITTVAPYSTGTVSVTNGSKTVTGSGTTFTSAMVGRKFRIEGQNAYYIIASFSSATSITLEQAFQGDTASGQSYSIFKDEYRLPANLDKLKIMRQIENGVSMSALGTSAFDFLEPTPSAQGTPRFNVIAGSKRDIYSTGTVSADNASSTITGSGTSWTSVDGLGKGTKLIIGSQVFTVKSVDSDTQITTYENTTSAVSAGASYELLMDNFIIQFFQIPNSAENIYFRYQRLPEPLINDYDIPDLPEQYHHLLINGGLSVAWKTKDKDEAKTELAIFLSGIEKMKKRIGKISQNIIYKRRSITDMFVGDVVHYPGSYGYPVG